MRRVPGRLHEHEDGAHAKEGNLAQIQKAVSCYCQLVEAMDYRLSTAGTSSLLTCNFRKITRHS